jgi:hypothetical protein
MAGHPGLRPSRPPFSLTERRLTYRHFSYRKKLRTAELKFLSGILLANLLKFRIERQYQACSYFGPVAISREDCRPAK